MSLSLKKVTANLASDVATEYELRKEVKPLLAEDQTPAEFLKILIDEGYYQDAITFLAHAMPVREAVWWGCVCSRHFFEDSDVKYQLALKAAETWVYESNEENRRVAEKYAEEGDYATPASWVAAAVFWSGGSISNEGDPAMEPPPFLYATAVSGAVVMAAGWQEPSADELEERFKKHLQHGISIADGGNG